MAELNDYNIFKLIEKELTEQLKTTLVDRLVKLELDRCEEAIRSQRNR